MSFAELEQNIEAYITASASAPRIRQMHAGAETKGRLHVIKYLPSERLLDVLHTGKLFAAGKPGYTWGDAVYVAPLASPLSTMMYGMVGVVGWLDPAQLRFYDAV